LFCVQPFRIIEGFTLPKVKLQQAEAQAAIDPGGPAQNTVVTLREMLRMEEPKLVQLLNEP
jgi:hypothetical protein